MRFEIPPIDQLTQTDIGQVDKFGNQTGIFGGERSTLV